MEDLFGLEGMYDLSGEYTEAVNCICSLRNIPSRFNWPWTHVKEKNEKPYVPHYSLSSWTPPVVRAVGIKI